VCSPAPVLRLLPLLFLLVAACRPEAEAPPSARALTDDLGRDVEITADVRRVIPLAPNLTEVVAAVGAIDRLIAISRIDDHPREIRSLPRVSALPLDVEGILSLRPDLLLANSAINRQEEADRLAALGVPTYFFSFTELADIPRALRTVGTLLDSSDQGEAAALDFETRIEEVRVSAPDTDRLSVLLLIGDQPLYAFGAASYTQEVIELAGGRSITSGFPGEGVTLSAEFVLDARPDVIIGTWGDDYDVARLVAANPVLRALPAVRTGRVYSVDPDLLERPGPRLADGARVVADILRRAAP
jgi:iron complex transport system substrate-binding protein